MATAAMARKATGNLPIWRRGGLASMTPAGASWGRPAQSPMAGTCSGVCGGVWRRWRSCGLVGMPNVGKSTLFNALTRTQAAQAANYPFCTIDPNVAVVDVPDARLDELARVAGSARSVPMRLELRDIAGLVKGASEGSGMGNEFLGHIRSTSCILQVVRCFDDDDVVHVEESVDPLRDIAIIENELVLADLESVERRVGDKKLAKAAAAGADSESVATLSLLRRCEALLAEGLPARDVLHTGDTLSSAELTLFHRLGLLTAKPVMVVCNVDEDAAASGNELSRAVQEWSAHRAAATTAAGDSSHCLVVSAKLEEEIANLDDEEARAEYLSEYGLQASGLDRVIQASTDLLGVHRFFTAGPQEARAWSIPRGATAVEAAGKIHSDLARGFICAETCAYDDYVALGGEAAAKAAGKLRQEGKDYVVADGDVMLFRFNV